MARLSCLKIGLYNHGIIQVGRTSLIYPPAHSRVSSIIRPGCSRLYPAVSWKPPWMEMASLWAILIVFRVKSSSLNFSCFNLCTLFYVISQCYKEPSSTSWVPSPSALGAAAVAPRHLFPSLNKLLSQSVFSQGLATLVSSPALSPIQVMKKNTCILYWGGRGRGSTLDQNSKYSLMSAE